jgi:peptide/nickel transport system ATP-binding protein
MPLAANPPEDQGPLLSVRDLHTHFFTRRGVAKAVDGVSFDLRRGEILAVVGESGSGKSVMAFSIVGLVDPPGCITAGQVLFRGEDLVRAEEGRLQRIRGAHIAMIFQDPMMSLNPVLTIGEQMIEAVLAHNDVPRGTARVRAQRALEAVGIASAAARLDGYPHQFSGGMRQRVVIATALLHRPDIIIADEPTTALDVTIQAQILYEMQKLCRDSGTTLIWITHDLAVVSALADRVAVMYAGRLVEIGPMAEVIDAPRHPYTRGLLDSVPSRNQRGQLLYQIPGVAPSLLEIDDGCAFRGRCGWARPECALPQALTGGVHGWRCAFPLGAAEV